MWYNPEMDLLLTVVTATFNAVKAGRAETLERCVRSVAALKVPHEHLVCDGGSTDGTVERLRRLERELVGVRVVSEPDRGIYDAFNKGWKAARGTWICYLGDDDQVLHPEALDAIVADATANAAEWVVTPAETPGHENWYVSPKNMRGLLIGTPYCHQGVLARRTLLERLGGFDLSFPIAADYDLFLRVHLAATAVRYDMRKFAWFSPAGLSSDTAAARTDLAAVQMKNLGLAPREAEVLANRRLLPLRKVLPLVFHRGWEVRLAARHAVKRWLADRLGLLDAAGQPKGVFR